MSIAHKNANEIKSIQFGIMSSEDILAYSVAEITSSKLTGVGSVYDERLGTMENNVTCVTCGLKSRLCAGHMGHITLNEYVIHPLYYKYIVSILKCVCIHCHQFLVDAKYMSVYSIDGGHLTKEAKFKFIQELVSKIELCNHCNMYQPKISLADNMIHATYKNNASKTIQKVVLTAKDILAILDNIDTTNLQAILGIDALFSHPRNLILKHIPLIAPRSRPFVITDNMVCDDDLTIQYIEIIKVNNHLNDRCPSESKRQKHISTLNFRIKCLMDNSHGKSRHANNRPLRGVRERVAGKSGIIRNHLMGKRVNQSARTVITPDVNIPSGWLAVPPEIAHILTVPEHVNDYNRQYLTDIVHSGQAGSIIKGETRINLKYALNKQGTKLIPGDIIQRKGKDGTVKNITVGYSSVAPYILTRGDRIIRNDQVLDDIVYPEKRTIQLNVGDIVERFLKDGDVLYFNRQPTLHTGSMIAHRIRVIPGKTFRFPLSLTKSFNADYDGDEMNGHSPITIQARAELETIADVHGIFMSAQSSTSNVCVVQDGVLGTYLMTKRWFRIPKSTFQQLVNSMFTFSFEKYNHKCEHIRAVHALHGIDPDNFYTGKTIFSFFLPDDFNFSRSNKTDLNEPNIRIRNGVLLEGTISKPQLNGSHYSISHLLYKEYNVNIALEFIDDVQFVANAFLSWFGFSTGLNDCLVRHKPEELDSIILKGYIEASELERTVKNQLIREAQISAALNTTKNIGMNIAKKVIVEQHDILNSCSASNNFVHMIASGSKGSYFNIAQITTLLGQQNIYGQRIQPQLSEGRTLIHYLFNKLTPEQKYESKGFIRHSFIHGLNPQEFFFHACSGRQGVIDTALKTSSSGYSQRKIVKVCEDLVARYDHTVRDINNRIVQFDYGDGDLDAQRTILVDDHMQFINASRLAEQLNSQVELQ